MCIKTSWLVAHLKGLPTTLCTDSGGVILLDDFELGFHAVRPMGAFVPVPLCENTNSKH